MSKALEHGWSEKMLANSARRYPEVLPIVRNVAREHGYAIAVHGSQVRDLDLVAVPWVDEAAAPEVLIEAIRAAVGGFILNRENADPSDFTGRNPEPKPHGRLGWSIHLGGGPYLDLSVMPRLPRRGRSWTRRPPR